MPNFSTISDSNKFSNILKQGRKLVGKFFILFYTSNQVEFSQFGIIASKKVGKAHERNRAKRLLREVIRQNQEKFPPRDYVFVARQALTEVKLVDLENELNKLILKISN